MTADERLDYQIITVDAPINCLVKNSLERGIQNSQLVHRIPQGGALSYVSKCMVITLNSTEKIRAARINLAIYEAEL